MSRFLRTMRFGFEENDVVNVFEWLNEIDESNQWQKGIYNALCGAYACVSLAAFVSTILSFSRKNLGVCVNFLDFPGKLL